MKKYILGFIIVLAVIAVGSVAYASLTFNIATQVNSYQNYTFFTATTTNATSTNLTGGGGYLVTAGAKSVEMYFSRGDTTGQGNTGASRFYVQVSPDGSNWYYYNTLSQNLATSTTPTTVGSVAISAATSTVIAEIKNPSAFYGVRCINDELTDGEATCKASVAF